MRFLYFLFIICSLPSLAGEFSVKYPYGLLTPGHGLVTEDDLAHDDQIREISPYDPETASAGGLYWQCFSTKDVQYTYEKWRSADPMGAWNKIVTMCSFEFQVQLKGDPQSFSGRRALPVSTCKIFDKQWRRLTKDQPIVCFNGETGSYYNNPDTGKKEKSWTWVKFKTRKGCYSYFANGCNTKNCSKGESQCRVNK